MNLFSVAAKTRLLEVGDTASTSVALPLSRAGENIRVVNAGPNIAFIAVGDQVATLPTTTPVQTCTPVLPGSDVAFSVPFGVDLSISAICKNGETATLYLTMSEGV
jgi:hypothetical protein